MPAAPADPFHAHTVRRLADIAAGYAGSNAIVSLSRPDAAALLPFCVADAHHDGAGPTDRELLEAESPAVPAPVLIRLVTSARLAGALAELSGAETVRHLAAAKPTHPVPGQQFTPGTPPGVVAAAAPPAGPPAAHEPLTAAEVAFLRQRMAEDGPRQAAPPAVRADGLPLATGPAAAEAARTPVLAPAAAVDPLAHAAGVPASVLDAKAPAGTPGALPPPAERTLADVMAEDGVHHELDAAAVVDPTRTAGPAVGQLAERGVPTADKPDVQPVAAPAADAKPANRGPRTPRP